MENLNLDVHETFAQINLHPGDHDELQKGTKNKYRFIHETYINVILLQTCCARKAMFILYTCKGMNRVLFCFLFAINYDEIILK